MFRVRAYNGAMMRFLLTLLFGLALLPGKDVPGKFDFYVLALSWSPQYCSTHNLPATDPQCGTSRRFGFVMHGLWPQYEKKGWPQNCSAGGKLGNETIKSMLDVMPSEKLIQHEWTKHGTCSGMDARGYFAKAREAYTAVQVPPEYVGPSAQVNVKSAEFKKQLAAANPAWKPGSAVILCSGKFLQEVRVCMSKDLKSRKCPASVRDQCKGPDMIVRPVR